MGRRVNDRPLDSVALVTDANGAMVGRVWYYPCGGIGTHVGIVGTFT